MFLISLYQRETELEEIVRRKKTIIKKLKRNVLVLEEKVRNLTKNFDLHLLITTSALK